MRLRDALANSINVPAVRTTMALGPDTLLRHLHALGFDSLQQDASYYGPALALGDGEVTLLELVRAYATLARGGQERPLRVVLETERSAPGNSDVRTFSEGPGKRIMPELDAAWLTDILKDPLARAHTFGRGSSLEFEFDVAVKTGTSKGYRDNWVVGYTDRFTLGVWVGNFDGRPMSNVGGATGAAPIFASMLRAALVRSAPGPLPLTTQGVENEPNALGLQRVQICPLSGLARSEQCPTGTSEWLPPSELQETCDWHRRVAVDKRNGLLAGPDCPNAVVEYRDYEYLPAEFTQWAQSARRPIGPADGSPHCPLPANLDPGTKLQITSPLDGARFVLDPDRKRQLQRLTVSVAAPPGRSKLLLQIDGKPPLPLDAFQTFDWALEPGEHEFVAVNAEGDRSAPVQIVVRAAQ
jgi:penicillin-binding protein 1C